MPAERTLGTTARPLRVAVIGSGPAGFYTVDALVKHKQIVAEVDLFERLPAPYGLVRYGVAPDHQKIKSVTLAYDKLGENPRVRFLGNVNVGHGSVSIEDLRAHYDQVVLAVGCETDRRLGIPGEDLAGSHAATSFVAWYNGHPDFRDHAVDLGTERAAIVGVGDVAMDLSRLLMKDVSELAATDMPSYAVDAFRANRVKEVVVLARRGPAQAAFAAKELEDIVDLAGVDVLVNAAHVRADLESGAAEDGLAKRKLEYLATVANRPATAGSKRVLLRFLASPVEILGEGGRVTGIVVEENALVKDERGRIAARGTGRVETIPVGLVFRSVGYRGVPIPGVPFDDSAGIVPNDDGRVLKEGVPWPNVYVSGWIKRGPSGVIGTNKSDAAATVQRMVEDLGGPAVVPELAPSATSRDAIDALLRERAVRVVTWADWKRLDALERARGSEVGKVREKVTATAEALAALET
jgi:ferredoxin--NADP+ reductase